MNIERIKNISFILLCHGVIILISFAIYFISRNGHVTVDVGTASLLISVVDKVTISILTVAFIHLTTRKWKNIRDRGSLIRIVESIDSIKSGVVSCVTNISSIEVSVYLLLALSSTATSWGLSKGIGTSKISGTCVYNEGKTHALINCTSFRTCGLYSYANGGLGPIGIVRTTTLVKNGIDNNITVLGNPSYAVAAHVGKDLLFSTDEVSIYNLSAIVVNASCKTTEKFAGESLATDPLINMTSLDDNFNYYFSLPTISDLQGLYVLDRNLLVFAIVLADRTTNNISEIQVGWLNHTQVTLRSNIVTLAQCNYTARIGLVDITQKNNSLQSSIKNLKPIDTENVMVLNVQMSGFNFDALTISNGNSNPEIDPYKYDGRYISGLETDFAKYVAASSTVLVDKLLAQGYDFMYTNDTFSVKSCDSIEATIIQYWPLLYVWLSINIISLLILIFFTAKRIAEISITCSGVELNTLIWQSLTTKWGLARLLSKGHWNTDQKDAFLSKMDVIPERLEASRNNFGLTSLDRENEIY
ncbi:5608_t:CDS:1 [Acaulospora morrowiae]|uniref:5608_t:CDS:1 n=1 Tax=Acaulospora morrowiae TaxID=94023 RepID=A0A9N9GCJ7_9GLOM|nr:5608_t:CDS:1 [Acaulospora morrowiae]